MTLAELAHLAGAEPKWVLNAFSALGREAPRHYTADLARRLAVTRSVHYATGMPISAAYALAARALRATRGARAVPVSTDDPDVVLSIDVTRILSSVSVRESVLRTTFAPRKRGRPFGRRRNAIRAAREFGLDPSLLADNLALTPAERLRRLDAMARFRRHVRRETAP